MQKATLACRKTSFPNIIIPVLECLGVLPVTSAEGGGDEASARSTG